MKLTFKLVSQLVINYQIVFGKKNENKIKKNKQLVKDKIKKI